MTRSTAIAAVLAVQASMAQGVCREPRNPAGDLAIVETFTTADGVRLGVQVLATNLVLPWSIAFAPDGRMFFTERIGTVRIVSGTELQAEPALVLTDVNAASEGGLLGIALHPDFAGNRYVYLFYTAGVPGVIAADRIVRYRESNGRLVDRAVLLELPPRGAGAPGSHHGGRIRFGPDRKLYVTTGDAQMRSIAQSLSALEGKVLRLNDDGTVPADNPFGSPIWTWGHRNPQGIAWHPLTGGLWATEHGETDKDEVNILRAGRNYGWPVIQGGDTFPAMETPWRFYTPGLAPSGMSFYDSPRIRAFRYDILYATLRGQHIHRIQIDPADPERILGEELWLERKFGRIRDVVIGPDGFVYFCTSNRDGSIVPVAADDRVARIVPLQ